MTHRGAGLVAQVFGRCALAAGAVTAAGDVNGARAEGDAAYGEYLSTACVSCHRIDGTDRGIPSIIGWPDEQFVAVLKAYRSGVRENLVMRSIASGLSDDDMAALASYYARAKDRK
ncbi:MAG: c-type cytochrome [Hyphomicrobiaceae bacterium]